ncbi:M55 family metallopeptidase [Streptomyces omiyaensis]|uniref:M55 family metallopeptidase n=1 Tax=Streptomyces omiyaensis TaxID=68247 RepID=A0ABW7BKW7_9ACTN|nr:M55 family metallopeptidase [Streptomyces omiyaensis]GGY55180.1 peptide ABC transporter substrate-binding protein [Streptomyces omiyaensis]
MTRVLVSADMEGVTGVTCPDDVEPGTASWARMRPLFTGDVNAVVDGLLAGGASDVLVNDAHYTQRNLLLEALDPRARLLTGRHKPLGMMAGIDLADAVVLLGYHTGAGQQGVLSHTYLGTGLTGFRIDGEPADEGRMNALIAEEHGVPVILVTGDDLTCRAAGTWAPDALTVEVKQCVSRYAAICLPPARSAELLRAGATEAAARLLRLPVRTPQEDTDPARERDAPGRPHRFELGFHAPHLAEAVLAVPTVEPHGPRGVAFTAPDATTAARTFKVCTTVAGAAMEDHFD